MMAVPTDSTGLKRIVPSAFHVPPCPRGTSARVRSVPPSTSTRCSFSHGEEPNERLSGDQNGNCAPSVPTSDRVATESIDRSHSRVRPSNGATNTSVRPSGEIPNESGAGVAGVATSNRLSGAGAIVPLGHRRIARDASRTAAAAATQASRLRRRDRVVPRGGARLSPCASSRSCSVSPTSRSRCCRCSQATAQHPADRVRRVSGKLVPIWLRRHDGVQHFWRGVTCERWTPGKHLEQHASERRHVRATVDLLPAGLLGRHVRRRPEQLPGADASGAHRRHRSPVTREGIVARPKSSTFTTPSGLRLMFAGFKPRWTTPLS